MNLPFTTEQFLQVFEQYNHAVWPLQILLNLLALSALGLTMKRTHYSDKSVSAILAVFWLWMGVAYHVLHFTAINKAAYGFGALFILQGVLFFLAGVVKSNLSFRYRNDRYGIIGGLILVYALIIYPILGQIWGHRYPQSPTFGLPCPTTIYTFGLLLWTGKIVPKYVLIIPVLWSIIGVAAALTLTIREDIGLFITGVIASSLIVSHDLRTKSLLNNKK